MSGDEGEIKRRPGKRSDRYLNRELSWLEFNHRVLEEARDPSHPLLERLKFFCIVSSNLDEFFEVRVAGLKQQIESGIEGRTADGLSARECFLAIRKRVGRMVSEQYACWQGDLKPALSKAGFRFVSMEALTRRELAWVEAYFVDEVYPVLTPLGIDSAHPFPGLLNKSLNIIVDLELSEHGKPKRRLAIVQVPRILRRVVMLPGAQRRKRYLFLEEILFRHLHQLFPGSRILGHWPFRVTRNGELYIDEEAASLIKAVEVELSNRRKGAAVRLEMDKGCPRRIRRGLLNYLNLEERDLYLLDGPLDPARLMSIYRGEDSAGYRDALFVAPVARALRGRRNLFDPIRQGDILLHHPYESFTSVVEFMEQAAVDPNVLAIKQTLYRSGSDGRIFDALMEAVRRGKQVTVVVELKARFDEGNNIKSARRLEEAGVHVLYGVLGHKIHAKMSMVVKKDPDGIRRYVHLGTGNYNLTTSRSYTDLGLLSARPDLGHDVADLFNMLTGICRFQGTRKLLVAPFNLRSGMIRLIQRETAHGSQGLPARIIAKMNALVDAEVIDALYEAAQAGVRIDLIVRGICCLRPGVPGLSETITVRSIVDRFLEHSRIFYFENACKPEVFLGSADWMPRNLDRRIETVFPIEDGRLRDRIRNELLETLLRDNVKARVLEVSGRYSRITPCKGERRCRGQVAFINRSTELENRDVRGGETPGRGLRVRRSVREGLLGAG